MAWEKEPAKREIVFRGSLGAVQEHFYDQLWSDGLPVLPPTIDSVEQFLRFTGRPADEVVAVLRPELREATVWNVAVNGMMAGCRPEYMPVLLAIVGAIAEPLFGLENAGSGAGWDPLITVSGPIIRELDFNFGSGLKRVGRQANTSIGRFLRLYMRNIAGLRIPPGEYDEGRIGHTFHVVLAEDEEFVTSLGWPTYGEDCGVPRDDSAVTVQSVMAESPPFLANNLVIEDPESWLRPLVEVFGKELLGYWSSMGMAWSSWHLLIVLGPGCAQVLADKGWTKDDVRRYLHENSRIPASRIQLMGDSVNLDIPALVREGRLPAEFHESDDPERLLSTFIRPECTGIVVAGDREGVVRCGFMNNHEHGPPITKRVEKPSL